MTRRSGIIASAVLALVFVMGCEGQFGRGERDVVAWVGDEPIRRVEFEAYLADNLLAIEEGEPVGDADGAVKSRLLDALIDQRLLLLEAARTRIDVTDIEIAVYAGEGDEGSGHAAPTREAEIQAHQRLMIEKLQEHMVGGLAVPTEEEVDAWATSQRERLLPGRPMELRALQLRSLEVARSVREEIRRGRVTFDEAIVAHEPSPGQTVSTRVSWDRLPPEVLGAIEKLEVGAISGPVELHGSVFLFEVGLRLEDPRALAAELRRIARTDLEQRRRQEALGNLLKELRGKSEIRIRSTNLQFPYVPAS